MLLVPDAISSTLPAVGCVAPQSLARRCPVVVVARARRFHRLRGGSASLVPCRLIYSGVSELVRSAKGGNERERERERKREKESE